MKKPIIIRSEEDLINDYEEISLLSRKNPVAITVNGKEDTVILCHDDYIEQQNYISELEVKLSIYSHLAQGIEDVKLGKVQKLDEAINEILASL